MWSSGQIQLADVFCLDRTLVFNFLCQHLKVKRLHIKMQTPGHEAARDYSPTRLQLGVLGSLLPLRTWSQYRGSGPEWSQAEGQPPLVIRLLRAWLLA